MKRSFEQTKTPELPGIAPHTSHPDQGSSDFGDVTRHHHAFLNTSPSTEQQHRRMHDAGSSQSSLDDQPHPEASSLTKPALTKTGAVTAYQRARRNRKLVEFKQNGQYQTTLGLINEYKKEKRIIVKNRVEYANFLLSQNGINDKVTQRTKAKSILEKVNSIRITKGENDISFDELDNLAKEYMKQEESDVPDISGLTEPTTAMKTAFTAYEKARRSGKLSNLKQNKKQWNLAKQFRYFEYRGINNDKHQKRNNLKNRAMVKNRVGFINACGNDIPGYKKVPQSINQEKALATINSIRSHQGKEPLTWERLNKKAQKFGKDETYVDSSDTAPNTSHSDQGSSDVDDVTRHHHAFSNTPFSRTEAGDALMLLSRSLNPAKPPDTCPNTSHSDQGSSDVDDVTHHHHAFLNTSPSLEEPEDQHPEASSFTEPTLTKEEAFAAYKQACKKRKLAEFKQKKQYKIMLELISEYRKEKYIVTKNRVEYTNFLLRQNDIDGKVTQKTKAKSILEKVNSIRITNGENDISFDELDNMAKEYMKQKERDVPDTSGLTEPTTEMHTAFNAYKKAYKHGNLVEFKRNEEQWNLAKQWRSFKGRDISEDKIKKGNDLRNNRRDFINACGNDIPGYKKVTQSINQEKALATINSIRTHQGKGELTWERLNEKAQKFGEDEEYVDTSDEEE